MSINKISSINIFLLINITISAVMMMTGGGSHQATYSYYVTPPRKTTTQQQQAAYPVIPRTARTIGYEYPIWPPKILTTTMTMITEFPYPIGPKTTHQPNGGSGYNPGPSSYPLSPCPPPPRPCIPPEGVYTANTDPGCCWQQSTPKTKITTKTPVYYPVHPPTYSSTETSSPDSANGALISKMLLARGGTPALWGKVIGIFTTIFSVFLFVQIL